MGNCRPPLHVKRASNDQLQELLKRKSVQVEHLYYHFMVENKVTEIFTP